MTKLQTILASFLLLAAATLARADHAAEVERLVRPLIDSQSIVGCVVGIVDQGNREVYPFGETRRGSGQAPSADTVYEIGSITKAFTGTLLAHMVARGELTLDTPIQELLPEGVTAAISDNKPITLRHLATHTSGLPRMPDNFEPGDPANPYADYTEERACGFLGKHKLRRAPGQYEYSNYGAGLLGMLLARRASTSYEQLVLDRIAIPLGMADTRIKLNEDQRRRLAPPYNGQLDEVKNWDFAAMAGAGALRSTTGDLLTLLESALAPHDGSAAAGGSPSRPIDTQAAALNALHDAWTARHGKPGEIGIGLGWHIARDGVTVWHNGQTGGYSSWISARTGEQLGVVVLSNTATNLTTELGEKIVQSALGMKVEPSWIRKVVKVDREILKKYVGRYAILPIFVITVTLEGDQLMAQATGQPKFPIYPESPTSFFYKIVDAQITFETDADGNATKLILHQNGAHLPGAKQAE